MKRLLPFLAAALAFACSVAPLRAQTTPTATPAASAPPAPAESAFDLAGFGRLPVLVNGRIKPMDTVARTSLLMFQHRQAIKAPDGRKLSPVEWLLDVFYKPALADTYRHFEITHPEVLTLFNLTPEDGDAKKRFSFTQLSARLDELSRQSELARQVDAGARTAFQKAIVTLTDNLVLYNRLKHSLVMPDSDNFLGEVIAFQDSLAPGVAAVRAKEAGQPFDQRAYDAIITPLQRFEALGERGALLPIPPPAAAADRTAWQSVGRALLGTFQRGSVSPDVFVYAGLGYAWKLGQPEQFNKIVGDYLPIVEKNFPRELKKTGVEVRFNAAEPFYKSIYLYMLAFFFGVASWLVWPRTLGRIAFWLLALGWVATTAGIITRMWLEGRPPVTNLYSSALFVGWGCALLCIVLEPIFKNGVGTVAGGMTGLCTLIIAHYLSLGGDTLEMMRAVLDTNFWLATHVVIITIGYSATYLAGFLAIIYVVRTALAGSLDKATADALNRMVYGIVCFATLFSLVGTILGGIWADQSWGRFWGWDPKENGALIIVIWNAIILHARWGGLARTRGIMALAIFGNIVTSWSWFGTNMLGVGLHSYGFMDAAFFALLAWVVVNLAFIGVAYLPRRAGESAKSRVQS